MHPHIVTRGASLSIALALAISTGASAQSRLTLPAGSVIIVRTAQPLQSATAQVGQTFDTSVEETIGIDEFTVIPAGSRIRGVITTVRPATRQQSGVIEVAFDQLSLASSTVAIQGKLTSTDSAERRQIKANPNARVALVGARGGIGAAIAGAGSGTGANSLLAALSGMLSQGRDVDVPAGTPLAVELQNAVVLRGGNRMRGGADGGTIYTAVDRVRAAQQSLAQRNYYRGAITGRLDDATRRALFQFQVDNRMNGTGNLDGRTAQALGINLAGALAGTTLSNEDASSVRRDAQSVVANYRADLGISSVGRFNPSRAYAQSDLDLLFALSAFADNAAMYEQVVRTGGNGDAAILAGRALAGAARRVDTAMQSARVSAATQDAWSAIRRRLTAIDTSGG